MKTTIKVKKEGLNDTGRIYEVDVIEKYSNGIKAEYKGQIVTLLYSDIEIMTERGKTW